MKTSMKISVFGAGYVGLANAVLLAKNNDVTIYDIDREKSSRLRQGISPFRDAEIEAALRGGALRLHVAEDEDEAWRNADFIFLATPTNYDVGRGYFDTTTLEKVVAEAERRVSTACIVVKSTIPIGWTESELRKHPAVNLLFSPEFLREGRALYDNLHPQRIIIGDNHAVRKDGRYSGGESAKTLAALMLESAEKKDAPVVYMPPSEAEAVKLFSNAYLALRVSFFNELDTFAELRAFDAASIIQGVCLDSRVGNDYNNPSFGYGGYCLPKDTKQLAANYRAADYRVAPVPNQIIRAIVESNSTRKDHIARMILERQPSVVGVYRLVMKAGSDNARQSAVLGVIRRLAAAKVTVLIYEPAVKEAEFEGCAVERDFAAFAQQSDVIIANRFDDELAAASAGVRGKVYTRDIWTRD
jgi:UDPglucose 6-dehydrogenase